MNAQAMLGDGALRMGMQIRGGPWKIVPLASNDVNPVLVFANEAQSARAASYQSLAEKIADDPDWNDSRQVFVSSPDEGDGKTSTAFNLAWALSTRAKPVLLTEMNLGRPGLRDMLGKPRIRYGIDCVLRKIATEKESVFSLVHDDLHVAAARDALARSEIRRFQPELDSFLSWARKEYQWIIVDCPPVLSHQWNDWLKERAGSVLLVVRSGKTPGVDVRRASGRLGRSLKGVVINKNGAAGWTRA